MDNRPPLPPKVIEFLFEQMALSYGSRLSLLWGGIEPAKVKAHWAQELSHCTPAALRHGLDHLHESNPPTLGEFKRLCRGAPSLCTLAITDRTMARPEVVAKIVGALKRPTFSPMSKQWAVDLCAREEAGERLSFAQQDAWRAALRFSAIPQVSQEHHDASPR